MDVVRSSNWLGSIPIVLTLATTSLGTTMMPHPIHVMVNRGTLLHVGLRDAIERLQKFAPATIHSGGMIIRKEPETSQGDGNSHRDEEDAEARDSKLSYGNITETTKKWKFPVCWFEDEKTQLPLRWHIFAGVLFDILTSDQTQKQTHLSSPQYSSSFPRSECRVPWKIRLHFSSYPSSQLLSLDDNIRNNNGNLSEVWTTIERSFKNSLKQALFLQTGTARAAMNMSKHIHTRLWEAVVSSNYQLYQQINADLQAKPTSALQLLPVRLYLDSKPPIQRPCRPGIREGIVPV